MICRRQRSDGRAGVFSAPVCRGAGPVRPPRARPSAFPSPAIPC